MQEWKRIAAISLGGAIGGLLRALVSLAVGSWGKFPIDYSLINIVGSFLLGVIQQTALRRTWPDWLIAGLGTGVMGGFTTFSTFVEGTMHLFVDVPILGFVYILASGLGGPVAAWSGQWLIVAWSQRFERSAEEVSA